MKKNTKTLLNNYTLDQYFKLSIKAPQKDTPNKNIINVPPSSGLPGAILPENVVLRYPTRPEWREYQQEIVSNCICYNTLVCLPTGLGKTHVAAVVIANFARWFPQQKIIFLAPTRPLVRQQISALKHMRDQVPPERILQVNGQLQAFKRKQLYQTYQVIFATPQTIENDLENGRLQGSQVVLIIIDECHRAVGNFSYSKIIRLMNKMDVGFRLIGLSATPGYEHDKIQEVISNLNITKVVYKDENQPEVKKYLHQKTIHEVEISENNIIKQAMAHLEKFAAPSLGLLAKLELMEPWMIRKGLAGASFFLIREKFSQRIDTIQPSMKNMAYSALKIVGFLSRCRKSLNDQGYQTFKLQFFSAIEPSKNIAKYVQSSKISYAQQRSEFSKDNEYTQQVSLDQIFEYYPQSSITTSKTEANPFTLPPQFKAKVIDSAEYMRLREMFHKGAGKQMHPKLSKLSQILQNFFQQREGKAIVFTQLRISAKQIKQYLQCVQGVRCGLFFGQSKTVGQDTQTGESFCLQLRQKDQLQLIQKYKSGQINTLISTSIGEEGLDIGEVDCIVCYDGGHSPIRAIQRRGRTGRKRAGEVYMLLMQGKEIQEYRKGAKKQSKMKDILKTQLKTFQYFPYNSSLFQENTIIPIQSYENVIQESAKKTKIIVSEVKPNEKQTKKLKKGHHKSNEKPSQPQIQQKPEQQLIEIHITTLGQLLQKYQGDSVTQQQQSANQSQASQQTPIIANTPFQQPTTKTSLLPLDLIDSSSESDDEMTMAEYFKQKRQEQSQSIILQEQNRDSIDSDELLSIIQTLRNKPEKTSLPAQN